MARHRCDIVILGAGFAGSLLSIIARKLGLDVVLLERGRHPRFAIGESSTPLANFKLAEIADSYDLSWLKPFAEYGSWKQSYPDIACGLKRGFSFFAHTQGKPFPSSNAHETELLVAANPDAEHGDTHWYRQEFDAFLVTRAVEAGVCYRDECTVSRIDHDGRWRIAAEHRDQTVEVDAVFAVDATGDAAMLARTVGIALRNDHVRTSSRAVFSHFENVGLWEDELRYREARLMDYPFACDAAALHHLIDGGWMWVLRFDNSVTSAGFSLDPAQYPIDAFPSAEVEWSSLLSKYPSIQRQFRDAGAVRPLVRTERLQRRFSAASGPNWALLPHTACFVDPWLSPGIAHTLFGVSRLARILGERESARDRTEALTNYSETVLREFHLIDRITAACFARLDCFDVLVALSMLYFVAVTFAEKRAMTGDAADDELFLLAHDPTFVSLIDEVTRAAYGVREADAEAFATAVASRLAPYNLVGLCDPTRKNMYPYSH